MTNQPEGLPKALQSEVIKVAATWTVAAIASLLVLAATGWWLFFQDWLIKKVGALPRGALVAFKDACPEGDWKNINEDDPAYAGSFIRLGSNNIPKNGGNNSITITTENIPQMTVRISTNHNVASPSLWGISGPQGQGKEYSFVKKDDGYGGAGQYQINSFYVGTSIPSPLRIEPTYISLVLCRKT